MLVSTSFFMAGLGVGIQSSARIRHPDHWSKWSAPFQHQDGTSHSIFYTSQIRTNLDTGFIERREIN